MRIPLTIGGFIAAVGVGSIGLACVSAGSAETPRMRAQIEAHRKREENMAHCRVLAQASGRSLEEVKELAKLLDWDMTAVLSAISRPHNRSENESLHALREFRILAERAIRQPGALLAESEVILRRTVRRVGSGALALTNGDPRKECPSGRNCEERRKAQEQEKKKAEEKKA